MLYIYLLIAIGVYFGAIQEKETAKFEAVLNAVGWPVLVGYFGFLTCRKALLKRE